METIKFSKSVSSIVLGNIARMNTSKYMVTKPLTHYQFSKNGIGYFQTNMEDYEIHRFLKKYEISPRKYKIINEQLSCIDIYLGNYDYIPFEDPDLHAHL